MIKLVRKGKNSYDVHALYEEAISNIRALNEIAIVFEREKFEVLGSSVAADECRNKDALWMLCQWQLATEGIKTAFAALEKMGD